MSKKGPRIQNLIAHLPEGPVDRRYRGYFDCFNRQDFFEAHEVLEDLWLLDRAGPNFRFYKGLIQLAGAFVHLQKNRLGPAAALFRLAQANLKEYPSRHEMLDLKMVSTLINEWLGALEKCGSARNPLLEKAPPQLRLTPQTSG